MQRSGKTLQTIADKEEMNFEGSLKYYFALVFWAKFEKKTTKQNFPLLLFCEKMHHANRPRFKHSNPRESQVYDFVFHDCMKKVSTIRRHRELVQKKNSFDTECL